MIPCYEIILMYWKIDNIVSYLKNSMHLVPSISPSPIAIRFPRGKRKWKRNKIEGCAPVLNGINLEHCFSAPRVAP